MALSGGKRGWGVGKTGFWSQTRLDLNLGAAVPWPGDLSEPMSPSAKYGRVGVNLKCKMHSKCLVFNKINHY